MKKVVTGDPRAARQAIEALFDEWPPVLVEARFPGTSPDWYLLHEWQQFEQVLAKLGPVAELHVNSVWDLSNEKNAEIVVARADLGYDTNRD